MSHWLVAAGIRVATVRVKVHMADGLLHAEPESGQGQNVGVHDVDEFGIVSIQPNNGIRVYAIEKMAKIIL